MSRDLGELNVEELAEQQYVKPVTNLDECYCRGRTSVVRRSAGTERSGVTLSAGPQWYQGRILCYSWPPMRKVDLSVPARWWNGWSRVREGFT